jgi:hypothetical protein
MAMDLEVFSSGGSVEADIMRAAKDHPKMPNAGELVLRELKRQAEAERIYEERHGG